MVCVKAKAGLKKISELTIKPGIFEKIGMYGDFHLYVGIVGNTTGTLIRKVIYIGCILASVPIGVVELSLRKHHQISVELATERNVDISWLVDVGNRALLVGKAADYFVLAIAEGVVLFPRRGYFLVSWVMYGGVPWIRGAILTRDDGASNMGCSVQRYKNE